MHVHTSVQLLIAMLTLLLLSQCCTGFSHTDEEVFGSLPVFCIYLIEVVAGLYSPQDKRSICPKDCLCENGLRGITVGQWYFRL